MRESSSSDLDRSRADSYQRTAIADFARSDPLPSIVPGAVAKERRVTACLVATNACPGVSDLAARQATLVMIVKDAGVG
jgi:hypothetical protein